LTEEFLGGPLQTGVLTPHATAGPEREFPTTAPGCVVNRLVRLADSEPAGLQVLRALTAPAVLDAAAAKLPHDSLDAVAYASTTSAYVIGFDAETAMSARIAARLVLPVALTCAAAVRALRALGIERLAVIGAPWFTHELNEFGARYFREQRFEVVFSRPAALTQDPSPAAATEWTLQHVPDTAEGIFIGGNGFRAAAAIDALETALDRPVLTANQVLLWDLVAQTHTPCEVKSYGRLFAHRPSAARRDRSGSR
jgi:maleate isomerase